MNSELRERVGVRLDIGDARLGGRSARRRFGERPRRVRAEGFEVGVVYSACADLRGERRGETFVRGRGGRCVHRFAALPGGVGIDLLRFGGLIRLAFFVGLDRRIFRLVDGWLARIRFVRVRPLGV